MKQSDAAKLAISLMKQHGLTRLGWRFEFDNPRRRLGACNYQRKVITLSKHGVYFVPDSEVTDTILHEIAHAIAGYAAGHGPEWKKIAERIGAKPQACYQDERIAVTGNTFPVKDALARLGAKWDRTQWFIEKDLLPFAQFIVEFQSDGKVIIVLEGRYVEADFSRPLFCSCESNVPASSKTPWEYRGERNFGHRCGRSFQVHFMEINTLLNQD